MTRSVPEWIGKNDDSTIPPRVKARIVARQDGICACGCGIKLGMAGERIEFDHIVALILGGENREGNIGAVRSPCHKVKTAQDVRQKAKEARVRAKHLGIARKGAAIPGSRASGWKRKMDGTVVRRGAE